MAHLGVTKGDRLFVTVNLFFITLLTALVLYPLIYVLSCSISDPNLVGMGKVWLLPKNITVLGYKKIFNDENIMVGYGNTIFYTFFGTLINLAMTLTAGYALSKNSLPGRKIIMTYLLITMYFSGGMIPTYLLIKNLNLLDTRLVLLISGAVSIYNLIICRTFFQGLPRELEEAALIDGCSVGKIFIRIVLPLSKALIGVITLYYGVGHWNSYFSALIYIADRKKLPLQIFLREILITQQTFAAMASIVSDEKQFETEQLKHLLKYSVIIVSSLPLLIIYPFLQKYFDTGVLLGSLKG